MTPSKRCTRCKEEKPATLEFFGPHKIGQYGLRPQCRPCKKLTDAEYRARPDQIARQQAWRDTHKDKVKAYNSAYRANGYRSTMHVARWRATNLEHARAKDAERIRKRRATDPAFLLKGRISERVRQMLLGKKVGRSTEALLGYTAIELCRHIERQFTKGMSWKKLRAGLIEIDHITPVSAFNIASEGDPDFLACWGLSNLRPIWTGQNRSKGNRRMFLL